MKTHLVFNSRGQKTKRPKKEILKKGNHTKNRTRKTQSKADHDKKRRK